MSILVGIVPLVLIVLIIASVMGVKENLASAKPSGAGGRLSCTYASRKFTF